MQSPAILIPTEEITLPSRVRLERNSSALVCTEEEAGADCLILQEGTFESVRLQCAGNLDVAGEGAIGEVDDEVQPVGRVVENDVCFSQRHFIGEGIAQIAAFKH